MDSGANFKSETLREKGIFAGEKRHFCSQKRHFCRLKKEHGGSEKGHGGSKKGMAPQKKRPWRRKKRPWHNAMLNIPRGIATYSRKTRVGKKAGNTHISQDGRKCREFLGNTGNSQEILGNKHLHRWYQLRLLNIPHQPSYLKAKSGIRTKSLPDKIPSAHFCIGGHNSSHVFCNVDIIPPPPPPHSFLQGGQNPFREFSN